jgi:hypothetical protein
LALVLVSTAVCFGITGFMVGLLLRKSPLWMHGLTFIIFVTLLRLVFVWAERRIEGLEGTGGEARVEETAVGTELRALPNDFWVLNHLSTPYGKVDHLVLGPTGIFALVAKDWKGVVSADGDGELLWNDHPTDEPLIRQLTEMVARLEEAARSRTGNPGISLEPAYVFSSARMEVKPGATGRVRCLAAGQLREALTSGGAGPRAPKQNLEQMARRFMELVREENPAGVQQAAAT